MGMSNCTISLVCQSTVQGGKALLLPTRFFSSWDMYFTTTNWYHLTEVILAQNDVGLCRCKTLICLSIISLIQTNSTLGLNLWSLPIHMTHVPRGPQIQHTKADLLSLIFKVRGMSASIRIGQQRIFRIKNVEKMMPLFSENLIGPFCLSPQTVTNWLENKNHAHGLLLLNKTDILGVEENYTNSIEITEIQQNVLF